MSWLSDITDWVGSAFTGGESSSGDSSSSIWPSLIQAGTSLAGTYYYLQQNKEQNDQQIQMAKDRLAAELEMAKKAGGGGGGGSALAAAKLGALSQLYQNWGQLASKAAESESQAAQMTGKLATDPIIARLGALR